MTVLKLNHRMLPTTLSASTPVAMLTAIEGALSSETDIHEDARTPGSGSAWTSERILRDEDFIGLRLIPPHEEVSDLRLLIVAATDITTGSPTPKLAGTTTLDNNIWYIGICKDVNAEGDFVGWDADSPYTGCEFSGYCRAFLFSNTLTGVYLFESQQTLWVEPIDNSSETYPMGGGAIAHATGLIYSVVATGPTKLTPSAHNSANTTGNFLGGAATGDTNSFIMGWDKANVFHNRCRGTILNDSLNDTSWKDVDNQTLGHQSITLIAGSSAANPMLGQLRDVYRIGKFQSGQLIVKRGSDERIGYTLSGVRSGIGDAFLLRY